jgi:hypothetical protein
MVELNDTALKLQLIHWYNVKKLDPSVLSKAQINFWKNPAKTSLYITTLQTKLVV